MKVFVLSILENLERFSYAFLDRRYLNLSLGLKHMLQAGSGGREMQ